MRHQTTSACAATRGRPLISLATGAESKRLVQLAATEFVPVPCTRHDEAEVRNACAGCGTVREGLLEMGWRVPRSAVLGRALFSQHRFMHAALFLRRTV